MNYQPQIICLMGPTAAGKTAAALNIAKHIPCEIVSVDSVMVYRGLDIGSAKPDKNILETIPHHLIDICDPSEVYSAAQFCEDASKAIEAIISRQRYPLLVGGTMLYFRALQQGLAPLPSADAGVRQRLLLDAEKIGWEGLHQRLETIDPQSAARIKAQDQQRIQRALEVYMLTGKPLTELLSLQHKSSIQYPFINIALVPPEREILHQRIAQRFLQMLDEGFIAEVQALYDRGDLNSSLPAIRAVGYRQVWQYLSAELTADEMQHKAIVATRQYAKRQLTWLRSMTDLTWFDSEDEQLSDKLLAFIGAKC